MLEGQLVGGLLAAKAGVPAPLVLIGDHEQLQPAVESQPLELEKSLGDLIQQAGVEEADAIA